MVLGITSTIAILCTGTNLNFYSTAKVKVMPVLSIVQVMTSHLLGGGHSNLAVIPSPGEVCRATAAK